MHHLYSAEAYCAIESCHNLIFIQMCLFLFIFQAQMFDSLSFFECVSSRKLPNSFIWARRLERALTRIALHCCALILLPDCPNKPEQTAGRQRRDVTHSSEPWRLSAWRRAGGLYSNNKQQASIPPLSPIHLRAAESWEQTGQCSFITPNLWCDYRSAHLQTAIVVPKDL